MDSQRIVEVKEFINNFLKTKYSKNDLVIDDDLDFLSSGIMSSLDFIEFISGVEKHFSIEFDFDNADPSEYSTILGIAKKIKG